MAVLLSYGDTLLTDEDVALLDGCVQSKAMRVRCGVSACTEPSNQGSLRCSSWHHIQGIKMFQFLATFLGFLNKLYYYVFILYSSI